jgi:hypothetical protein
MLSVLTTNQRGLLAETAIMHECIQLGIGVARPIDDEPYDLILDLRPRLLRVQCKAAKRRGSIVAIRCRRCRRGPDGLIARPYGPEEIDAIAAFCLDTKASYLLPHAMSVDRNMVFLRLAPSKNNQQVGINWARDFELGATLSRMRGPIAQLGERLDGIQKAAGSSPAGST